MSSSSKFNRATRKYVKIKALVIGPSGSGKTIGALRIADGLAPGQIAVIDSEHDRSSYYADSVAFDSMSIEDTTARGYIEAINAAVDAGYQALVIDSLSHGWMRVLNDKDAHDDANPKARFTSWGKFGSQWDQLLRHILEAPIHIIATARSKQSYAQDEQTKKVSKLGLQPVLRDGAEYEFALVFNLAATHKAVPEKDNTGLFSCSDTTLWDLCDGSVPTAINTWLSTAKQIAQPTRATAAAIRDTIAAVSDPCRQERLRVRWAELLADGQTEEQARGVLAKMQAQTTPSAQNLARLNDEVAKVHEAAGLPISDEPVTADTRTAIMDHLMYLESFKTRPGVQDFINEAAKTRLVMKSEGAARRLLALAREKLGELQRLADVAA